MSLGLRCLLQEKRNIYTKLKDTGEPCSVKYVMAESKILLEAHLLKTRPGSYGKGLEAMLPSSTHTLDSKCHFHQKHRVPGSSAWVQICSRDRAR